MAHLWNTAWWLLLLWLPFIVHSLCICNFHTHVSFWSKVTWVVRLTNDPSDKIPQLNEMSLWPKGSTSPFLPIGCNLPIFSVSCDVLFSTFPYIMPVSLLIFFPCDFLCVPFLLVWHFLIITAELTFLFALPLDMWPFMLLWYLSFECWGCIVVCVAVFTSPSKCLSSNQVSSKCY